MSKIIINNSPKVAEFVPYSKEVKIYKAPTDESIKILNEFKEKALQETVKIYKTKDCPIDLVITASYNPVNLDRTLIYHLTIGGRDFNIVKNISPIEPLEMKDIIELTKKVVFDCIVEILQPKAFKTFSDIRKGF